MENENHADDRPDVFGSCFAGMKNIHNNLFEYVKKRSCSCCNAISRSMLPRTMTRTIYGSNFALVVTRKNPLLSVLID